VGSVADASAFTYFIRCPLKVALSHLGGEALRSDQTECEAAAREKAPIATKGEP